VDEDVLPQCRGELVPGASAIEGVNPGVYRWRQLGTRSLNGVVGDASVASAAKGARLLEAIAREVAEALAEPRLWSAPI
jgi:creatinine amidohydrolase/Fe(II)-dependent formamide hydrolase-like protein